METFSALLAICAENSPVSGELPSQRPVTRSFDVFFDLRLNKRLSKLSWGWWFETLPCPLWRHNNPCLGWWLAARSAQSHNLNQCWLLFNPTEISQLKFEWKYKICISTKWAGKCLLNVTRSEITHNSTSCLITCLSLPKGTIGCLHYRTGTLWAEFAGHFVREVHQSPWVPLIKG